MAVRTCLLIALAIAGLSGCHARRDIAFGQRPTSYASPSASADPNVRPPTTVAAAFEQPLAAVDNGPLSAAPADPRQTLPPWSVRDDSTPPEIWALSLEEAVQLCLTNSQVFRELSGRIIESPGTANTRLSPALQELNPRFGVAAALAEFDARFAVDLLYARNEQTFNNLLQGGGVNDWRQNQGQFRAAIVKQSAVGTRFSLLHRTDYDRNNGDTNLFRSFWTTEFAAGFDHPLLRGSGVNVNRIAGPNAIPGEYRGVVIARLNSDIAEQQFEANVRDLLYSVERAYWELYFAYRRLDARTAARDAALETWRVVQSRVATGEADGEQEALARERYFSAKAELENALQGTPPGTPSRTVTTHSLASHTAGVYALERRLRFLCGLVANDGQLIRPADELSTARVVFDWFDSLAESLGRRAELREQRMVVRQRQLELFAARNQQQMRLNVQGQYGVSGFGDHLFGSSTGRDSAVHDLLDGRLQNWNLGVHADAPIGNRAGHAAARHAHLNLRNAHIILREQEHHIAHQLGNAFGELDRAYTVSQTMHNRRLAAQEQFEAIRAKYAGGNVLLEFVLDAQQRLAAADSDYFRALADYNAAIAAVHFQRGTYLAYVNVHLSEMGRSRAERIRVHQRVATMRQEPVDYVSRNPAQISEIQPPALMDQEPVVSHEVPKRKIRAARPLNLQSGGTPELTPAPALQPTPAQPLAQTPAARPTPQRPTLDRDNGWKLKPVDEPATSQSIDESATIGTGDSTRPVAGQSRGSQRVCFPSNRRIPGKPSGPLTGGNVETATRTSDSRADPSL